jgi:hypothetical protein
VREVLDTDTRDGQRIPSWLMVRSPAIDPAPPE